MAAMAGAVRSVRANDGDTARARSSSIWPAPLPESDATSDVAGSESGASGSSRSARRRSGARLVARTTTPGQASTSRATSGEAGSRCSRLSSTRRRGRPPRWAATTGQGRLPPPWVTPRTWATVGSTSAGSRTAASSTTVTAPPNAVDARRPASIASRVLPTPPGPVRVSSRVPPGVSGAMTSPSSRRRPNIGGPGSPVGPSLPSGTGRAAAARSAAARSARCGSSRSSASARARKVCGYGLRRSPRSSAPMAFVVSPARSASSSWVSAPSRKPRSRAANSPRSQVPALHCGGR